MPALELPMNILGDKKVREIDIFAKLKSIDPKAFENTADTIEKFTIRRPYSEINHPIEDISFEMFETFTNLNYLSIASTMLNDEIFSGSKPFSDLDFPNLGKYK